MLLNLRSLFLFFCIAISANVSARRYQKIFVPDTTVYYQEGINEYYLKIDQQTFYSWGVIHKNSQIEKVILHVENPSKDTFYITNILVEGEVVQWEFPKIARIAPHQKIEIHAKFSSEIFMPFTQLLRIDYKQKRKRKFFLLSASGDFLRGKATVTNFIPPKIPLERLAQRGDSTIFYNGDWYNSTNSNGLKEGQWVYFYKDGTVKELVNYHNGYEVGDYFAYYPEGYLKISKDYTKHIDCYYAQTGQLDYRVVPDSIIYYYPSGKIEQITMMRRIEYFEETGARKYSTQKGHELHLQDYEMVLNSTYFPNGNLKQRTFLNGKIIYYAENERDCPVKMTSARNSYIMRDYYYKNCTLDYIDVHSHFSSPYAADIKFVQNERGEFNGDTLVNGIIRYIAENGDTLFWRKIVGKNELSDIYMKNERYNHTDSLGRKQGVWIYNSFHSQRWQNLLVPKIAQKYTYRNDSISYPFYQYYDSGELENVYYGEVSNGKPSMIKYSRQGNVIGEQIGIEYFGYLDSTAKVQYFYNNGNKMDYEFKNGKLIKRTTEQQESYLSLEMPSWRSIPYTVSEGFFKDYHLYDGAIKFYSVKGTLTKTQVVEQGAINGDRILIFKDLSFENELVNHNSISNVDRDKNGYITISEASAIEHLMINGNGISSVADFSYFTRLKTLTVNHVQIDSKVFRNQTKLLAEIKHALTIPYSPPNKNRYNWNDIVEEPYLKQIEEDQIHDFVDVDAHFPGGIDSLNAFIKANLNYPEMESGKSIRGIVYVRFVVQKDGTISNIELAKGVSDSMDKEALRVIRIMPKWIPGTVNGAKVAQRLVLPVRFGD